MKIKVLQEQLREELMHSHKLYCCYCLEPKNNKLWCCEENHFLAFRDLIQVDQDYLISAEASQVLYDVL